MLRPAKSLEAARKLQQTTDTGGEGMRQAGYIGLDVGTSGCKASVLDGEGRVLVTASREYRFEYPAKGMVELNPKTVWNCVKETLREIASSGYEVRMLSVSSIGEAMVMLDREDRVLYNGINGGRRRSMRSPEGSAETGCTVLADILRACATA